MPVDPVSPAGSTSVVNATMSPSVCASPGV